MIAVMQRLQSLGLNPLLLSNEEEPLWAFNAREVDKDLIESMVSQHAVLTFEYTVLCTHLVHSYHRDSCTSAQITEQLLVSLMSAELLGYIYQHYLAVPREVLRLQHEQEIYRDLLRKRGVHFNDLTDYEKNPDKLTQFVRQKTANSNWYRLFLIRSKRLLNSITPLVKNAEKFTRFMAFVDKYGNPFLAYLSWVFYLPRLATNLFLLLKHLIPGSWMDEREKELGFLRRLQVQLQRRWFEIGNDSVWMIAGILGCFVWLGPLAPIGTYINVVLYGYDVLLAGIRAGLELYRLQKLSNKYNEIAREMRRENVSVDDLAEISHYQKLLHERIGFEQKRLLLSTATAFALTIAIIICAPVVAVNPWIALAGAILLLSITIISFCLTQLLERYRPSSNISKLPELDKFHPEIASLSADKPSGVATLHHFFKPAASVVKKSQSMDDLENARLGLGRVIPSGA